MGRLASFAGGVVSGSVIGSLLGLLFTPESGDDLRRGLRTRYQNAVAVGQAAAELKRLELEAELAQMTGVPPAEPPVGSAVARPGARAS